MTHSPECPDETEDTIAIAATTLMDLGHWEHICDALGYDVYCMRDGRMDEDEKIHVPLSLARELGLINF